MCTWIVAKRTLSQKVPIPTYSSHTLIKIGFNAELDSNEAVYTTVMRPATTRELRVLPRYSITGHTPKNTETAEKASEEIIGSTAIIRKI
jgi:hypothetical protein